MKKLFYLLLLLLPCIVKAEITNFTISSAGEMCFAYSGSESPTDYKVTFYALDNQYNLGQQNLTSYFKSINSDGCIDLTENVGTPDYSMNGNHNYKYEVSYLIVNDNDYMNATVVDSDYKVMNVNNGVFTELQPHTIRFHLNGGSWTNEEIPTYMVAPADEISIYEMQTLSLDGYNFTPLKNGFTFFGWYLEDDFSGEDQYSVVNPTQDVDLYAKWVSNDTKFTIRFETEDGSLIEEQKVQLNETINDVEAPAKEGYTFFSWCVVDGDSCYPTTLRYTMVNGDMTLRTKYIENSKVIKDVNIYIRPPRVGDNYTVDFDNDIGVVQKPDVIFMALDGNAELDWNEIYSKEVVDNGGGELFEGTVVKNAQFSYFLTIKLPKDYMDDYTFVNAQAMNIVINGKKINPSETDCFNPAGATDQDSDIRYTYCTINLELTASEAEYKVLDGQEQKIEKGSDLVIRFDGDINKFVGLVVDGKAVDSKYYKLEAGSTIVTLDKSYLDTLENGEYEITALYSDGDVSTSFNIINPENVAVEEKKDDAVVVDKKEENPFTADSVIIAIIGLSISLLAFGYFFRQKYLIDKERKEFAM